MTFCDMCLHVYWINGILIEFPCVATRLMDSNTSNPYQRDKHRGTSRKRDVAPCRGSSYHSIQTVIGIQHPDETRDAFQTGLNQCTGTGRYTSILGCGHRLIYFVKKHCCTGVHVKFDRTSSSNDPNIHTAVTQQCSLTVWWMTWIQQPISSIILHELKS